MKTLLATALLGLASMTVHATPISVGEAQPITAKGQHFVFSYLGLPASDGNGGTFLFRARGDYTFPDETATITLEGLGSLVLGGDGVVSNTVTGLTLNADHTGPVISPLEIRMEYVFDVAPLLLDTLLFDGNIVAEVQNSDGVDVPQNPLNFNFVRVNFDYESATVVPEPGTLLLVSSGLLGLVGYRRRQKLHSGTPVD